MGLLEALLDTVPAAEQTLTATTLTAPKAAVLACLARKEAAPELTPDTLRQRILVLNRAAADAAKRAGAAQPEFVLKSGKTTLKLHRDPTRGLDLAKEGTRRQLKRSLIEDTPPSNSAILQTPRATDAAASRVIQVFISHAWETPEVEQILEKFLERLRYEVSHLPPGRPYRIKLWFDRWNLGATAPTFDDETVAAARASEIAIFVLSNKWYNSKGCQIEAKEFQTETGDLALRRIIRLQLSGHRQYGDAKLVSGPILPELFCQRNAHAPQGVTNLIDFCDRASTNLQIKLAEYICQQIMEIIETFPPDSPAASKRPTPPPVDDLRRRVARHGGRIEDHDPLVREHQALPPRASREEESSDAQDLLPALERWVRSGTGKEPAKNRVCVLLGSFGSGKTIATQMFARHLHDLREAGEKLPFPIYLDFRRLISKMSANGDIPPLQDLMADALSDKVGSIDGQMVLKILRDEPCVILFDGLDEIGTALGVEKTARLYRQLLEIVPRDVWNRDAEHKAAQWKACGIRIMVTCRSHFFRSVIQQRTTFAEYSRQSAQPDVAASELQHTYYMAPFTEEQIERFFIAALGDEKGRDLFAAIGRVGDLPDLASKPVMTRFVAELSGELMADHAAGRVINAATLYGHLFNKALARDGEKEVALEVRYQQDLLQALALHLWTNNTTGMRVTPLETWFDNYIIANPQLTLLSHNKETPVKRLQTELRNASLLVRQNDDEFRFVHTSFFEYFLALALKNRLTAGVSPALPSTTPVNPETRNFLLDCAARDDEIAATGRALGGLLRAGIDPATRQFAWDMLALGRDRGFAWPLPARAHCAALDLRDQAIGPGRDGTDIVFDTVDFTGANFLGASITRAAFLHCVLADAVLSGAWLDRCRLTACTGKPVGGAMVRLHDSHVDGPTRDAVLTDVLFSFPPAPGAMPNGSVLRIPAALGASNSAVFSPDGACVLTASHDRTARLFDRASGREIARFQGHRGWVRSAVFSPDGACVLTASNDGTARLFDRASGREIVRFRGHGGAVTSAVFSPDGACVLTAGEDGNARLFDRASGREIARFQGHGDSVRSAVFSPDGACVLTAGNDGTARLFDRASGREIVRFQGHGGWVRSAVFSPDGACVLTAGGHGTARLFDRASGRCLGQLVPLRDDYAVCDPDGQVLSTGPNGWKYLYALAPVPGGPPQVCCPGHVPVDVPVPLFG